MFTTTLQRRFFPREADALSTPFGRLFPRALTFEPELVTYPAAEVVDAEKEFIVTLEVPGLVKDDVTINFEDGVLSIAGEKKEEAKDENQKYYVFERSYGAFQRAFTFATPVDVEKIVATMKHGVLTLHLPKITAQKELGKKILISETPAVKA